MKKLATLVLFTLVITPFIKVVNFAAANKIGARSDISVADGGFRCKAVKTAKGGFRCTIIKNS